MGGVATDSSKTSYSLDRRSRPARNPEDRHLGLARADCGASFLAAPPFGGDQRNPRPSLLLLLDRTWLFSLNRDASERRCSTWNKLTPILSMNSGKCSHGTFFLPSHFAASIRVPRETSCILESSLLDFRWRGIIWLESSQLQIKRARVGKTTTAVNLAACLAMAEQPTLLVDCDSQANATAAIGLAKDPSRRTLYHSLILNEPFDRIIQKSQVDALDVIRPIKPRGSSRLNSSVQRAANISFKAP